MPHTIRNEQLILQVDDPLENYMGSRFDWSGKLTRLSFEGVELLGVERRDKTVNQIGRGLYNEFGIEKAVGFNEVEIGDWFHKIGVGLLKKTSSAYSFAEEYEVKPCTFSVFKASDFITIDCVSEIENGFGYRLNKRIELHDDGLEVQYSLRNTGQKEIVTDEYNHNFLSVNQRHVNGGYRLQFPFELKPESFTKSVNPKENVVFGSSGVTFKDQPGEFFFSRLTGGEPVEASWQLMHAKEKIVIREKASFSTHKINLWGNGRVICPELFHQIYLPPGESTQWSRIYKIERLK